MPPQIGRSPGLPRAAALLVAIAALAYLLYPVELRVEGAGILRPVLEEIATVRPAAMGMVARVNVRRLQAVEAGDPLFALVGPGQQWSVLAAASGSPEGSTPSTAGEMSAAEREDAWTERRVAEQRAANDWYGQVLKAGGASANWEGPLCTGWLHLLYAQTEFQRRGLQAEANEQAGRDALNQVHVFDEAAGEYRPATGGEPFPSPVSGTVVSLWVAPGTQVGYSLPAVEIMPRGGAVEVLGVIPAAARPALAGRALAGSLHPLETPLASRSLAVARIELGAATLQPSQVAVLFAGVPAGELSAVARVLLKGEAHPADVGRVVRFSVGTGHRPRLWSWIAR